MSAVSSGGMPVCVGFAVLLVSEEVEVVVVVVVVVVEQVSPRPIGVLTQFP